MFSDPCLRALQPDLLVAPEKDMPGSDPAVSTLRYAANATTRLFAVRIGKLTSSALSSSDPPSAGYRGSAADVRIQIDVDDPPGGADGLVCLLNASQKAASFTDIVRDEA